MEQEDENSFLPFNTKLEHSVQKKGEKSPERVRKK